MDPSDKISDEALALERKAAELRTQQKNDEAFEAYDQLAGIYRRLGEHLRAAVCYASAATCWNIYSGQQPFHNAATRNHLGAKQAMLAKNYDYARSLYREAALQYEKEGDYEDYSECFLESQHADAMRSWEMAFSKYGVGEIKLTWQKRTKAFFRWVFNRLSALVWGYGEKPFRTIFTSLFVIVISAWIYEGTDLVLMSGIRQPINFGEALYFSVVTFTTVGYGDFVPIGWARWISMIEVMSGVFLTPLFVVSLTRRYLRMYR